MSKITLMISRFERALGLISNYYLCVENKKKMKQNLKNYFFFGCAIISKPLECSYIRGEGSPFQYFLKKPMNVT
jgi:hypothetical protein